MTTYLKGLHLIIDGWREGRDKEFLKTYSQLRVHLQVWEWENNNWIEGRKLEALRLENDETFPEWLDPPPRLREDIVVLKRITAPEKPAVTRCRASESMNEFYLIRDASGRGFGSGLWDHEGMIYNFGKLVDTMEKRDLQLEGGNQSYCQS